MKLIAHRSGPVNHPEQTILSAKDALRHGADMIELDVRFTVDGELAVSHDSNLFRVFGRDAEVGTLTAEQFLSLRHKGAPEYSSHLFRDYLAAGVEPILIHLKESEVIPKLLETIDEFGYADKVVIGVFKVESVKLIREHDPRIRILSFAHSISDTGAFIEAGVDYIRLWDSWLNDQSVSLVKNSASRLWVMSGADSVDGVGCPTETELQRIISYDPDGILINDVTLAIPYIE